MVGKSNSSVRSTFPGILAIDLLVDLDQLQRARADLEQVVVDVQPLALEGRIADRLSFSSISVRDADSGPCCAARSAASSRSSAANSPSDVALLEQMALDLAAGGLRDALTGTTSATSSPVCSLMSRETCARERQEILDAAAVQHEHDQLVGLRAARAHAGGHHLAELQARGALRDAPRDRAGSSSGR